MDIRMPGFRLNPPSPFWFEDLMFFVIDEGRRLPARVAKALSSVRLLVDKVAALDFGGLARRTARGGAFARPAAAPQRFEVVPLEGAEAWALATEPLVAAGSSADSAIALHRAAGEQLDALSYVLDRMRDELRPMMAYARFDEDTVHPLQDAVALDTSIEALLELSRRNAATRPKDRVLTAA